MIGEHHSAEGAGADAGEFDDTDTLKRTCHVIFSQYFPSAMPVQKGQRKGQGPLGAKGFL
jgi:hypothetical protein